MVTVDRRTFLKLAGVPALGAALPIDLSKALAIPAHDRTRSIRDVEHVVFLMQENRSFDHYFGTLRGVRGFAEPHPVTLPSGKSVFHQPDGDGELLPFRPDVPDVGRMFLPDPPHGWADTHAAFDEGRHDRWVPNKGVQTMTYHTRPTCRSRLRWPRRSRSATTTTARCSARPTQTATTCGPAGSATTARPAVRSSRTPSSATTGGPTRSGCRRPG